MKRYPKIKRLGHPDTESLLTTGEMVVQEKLDGANFRFTHQSNVDEEYHDDDRELVFGSRNVEYKNEKDVDKSFRHATEYVRENLDERFLDDWRHDDAFGPLVFFGEAMHHHTLDYEWDEIPNVVLFDVWDADAQSFLPWDNARSVIYDVGLEPVPVFERTSVDEFDPESFEIPESRWRDGNAEGVVFKNHETGTYAKLRSEEFQEKHGQSFEGSPKHADDDTRKLMDTYVTNARIEKNAHKLVDEGGYDGIQMEMMAELPMVVIEDTFEEEHEEIVLTDWEVDFGKLRSDVSSRCARVLKQLMTNKALNREAVA